MKDTIRQLIQQALTQLVTDGVLPEGLSPAIQVENARDKTHGDFASNIAMMLAKPAGMKPRDLAEKLIDALPPALTSARSRSPAPASSTSSRIPPPWPTAWMPRWPMPTWVHARPALRKRW